MSDRRITQLGTHVRLPDGREGTTVFNGLIGVGIKWGIHYPKPEDFEGTTGNTVGNFTPPDDWPWEPNAILRDPWPGCDGYGFASEACVGEEWEII